MKLVLSKLEVFALARAQNQVAEAKKDLADIMRLIYLSHSATDKAAKPSRIVEQDGQVVICIDE